jgi:hypothetical protein
MIPQENQRIDLLEKEVLGIGFQLNTQSKVLEDIKNILVKQSEILADVNAIRQSVIQIREDVDELEETFEDRKQVTDNNNKSFSDFVAKFKGGLAVTLFFFTIVQGSVAFVLNENYNDHKQFTKEIQQLQVENAVIKDRLKLQGISKTVQKAVESTHN